MHPAGASRPRHRRGAPARGRGARHRTRHRPDGGARPALPRRRRPALPRRERHRAAGRARPARRRARRHRHPGLPHLLPHRRRGHRPDPRARGAGRRPRLGSGQPGQPPARHQRGRPDPAPPAHGAVLLTAARRAARHRRRRRVGPAHRDLRGGAHPLRRRAGHLRVDDGHLQGAPRGARRRRRAGAAAGRGRRDRQGVPAHPRQGRPARHRRPARAAQPRPRQPPPRGLLRPRRGARRPAPAHRAAPVRRRAVQRRAARPHPGRGELDRVPDEPVRQGRRRDPGLPQARRPRHPHAVVDGARRRRGRAGLGGAHRPRRRGTGAARRPRHLRADPHHAHPGDVPDREPRPARARRQARAEPVRRPHRRHLAVPARARSSPT